ncbi:MAG: PLP-dependent aminotransferase family protein [Lachnospiraceae bacterium]|nr:PLP-dependent aminotransferase family protein [Lachnospiraceae bacterium]
MLTYNIQENMGKKTAFIYECIKNDIRSGELKAGEKLPSKRAFATHLGVSVITVENAYAMLEEEGYIASKPRSGFYVCELNLLYGNVPDEGYRDVKGITSEDRREYQNKTHNKDYENKQGIHESQIRYLHEDRMYNYEDNERIPQGMVKIMRQVLSEKPEILLEKPPHLGCAPLRNAIADYLRRYRGMKVQPANIVIGSGAEYLYGMLVQLFGRDKVFGIEYPSYEKIEQVYIQNGAQTERLHMAEDGIDSGSLQNSSADVLHVSPYHSYPTGITASASKRYEYLAWAKNRNAYLIEDDFDSEFAFLRKPIEPMFSMERDDQRDGKVIYLNTFSKSLAPSIRVAYMVLPDRLMRQYMEKLGFYSCTVPVFDQYVLAEYIGSGTFERHLNRIRRERLMQT